MYDDFIIGMATSVILTSIKDPAKKAKLKKSMAKIYLTIGNLYAGDEEFQVLVNGIRIGSK